MEELQEKINDMYRIAGSPYRICVYKIEVLLEDLDVIYKRCFALPQGYALDTLIADIEDLRQIFVGIRERQELYKRSF